MRATWSNRQRETSALVRTARQCSARGDYRQAEARLREALKLVHSSGDASVLSRPALWNELGMVCKYLGKFDKAERYYRLALRHTQKSVRSSRCEFFLANVFHNLGGVEHSRGRYSRAAKYARKGLQLRLECAASDSLPVASDRAALAAILHGLGNYKEAETHYRAALRVYRREYGASHPEIAVVLNNLGAFCQATRRMKRSEFYYRSALEMKRSELGYSHPDVAVTMNNLAMLYIAWGKSELAQAFLQKALQILKASLGASHLSTRAVTANGKRII